MENYAAIKALLPAQRGAGRHRGDRRRRRLDARRRRAHRARRHESRARLGAPAAARRLLRRGHAHHAARRAARRSRSRSLPASARCAACTMRRTRPAPSPPASRSASISPRSRRGWSRFPASRTACSRSAARDACCYVNDSKATNADSAAQGAGELQRHFLDRRRQAEDRRHHEPRRILPAHPQGLSDRRGGGGFRHDAGGQGALTRSTACSPARSTPPTRDARSLRR